MKKKKWMGLVRYRNLGVVGSKELCFALVLIALGERMLLCTTFCSSLFTVVVLGWMGGSYEEMRCKL